MERNVQFHRPSNAGTQLLVSKKEKTMRNRSQDDWNRNSGNRDNYRPGENDRTQFDQGRGSSYRDQGWTSRSDDDGRWASDDRRLGDRDRQFQGDYGSTYRVEDDRRYDDSRSWRADERRGDDYRYGGDRGNGRSNGGYGGYGNDRGSQPFGGGYYSQGGGYGADASLSLDTSRQGPYDRQRQFDRQIESVRQQNSGERFGQSRPNGRGFAGKGPKGYTRSDDRIRDEISDALMADDDLDASEIEIKVERGEVTLTGTVDSREAKRSAEEIAERCQGVGNVQNSLRVSSSTSGNHDQTSRGQSDGDRQRNARNADGESASAEIGRDRQSGSSGSSRTR
jgi:osmotically-inducible protein OsmY